MLGTVALSLRNRPVYMADFMVGSGIPTSCASTISATVELDRRLSALERQRNGLERYRNAMRTGDIHTSYPKVINDSIVLCACSPCIARGIRHEAKRISDRLLSEGTKG